MSVSLMMFFCFVTVLFTNKLCEMYVRPVRSPGSGEGVDINLISSLQLQQHGLAHHVHPLVFTVLVNNASHVHTILSQ